MSCRYGHADSSAVVPAEDKNPEAPAPPAEHEATAPELLNKLIVELDEVRNERGRVMAEGMAPATSMNKPRKSNVRAEWERRNKDFELSQKEDSLMAQVRALAHLLPPGERPPSLGF